MTTYPHYLDTLDYLPLENMFFPAELPSDKVMILLHGRGGKAEDFSWIPNFFGFDDVHYVLLNAPTLYEAGYSWYDDHLQGIDNSSTLLTQTLDMLFEKDFDASKSFLFGFSQGALLTFEFGARYTDILAGYIAISGHIADPNLLLKEMNPKAKQAHWLCVHGTKDEALNFTVAKEQMKVLQKAGMSITFKSYDKAHTIETNEMQMIREWILSNF